ncbi:glycoside hydrolase family 27 protein [Amylocarpus encephaloides]|uniref:Alpha-galactosidase n=1 Tax=Amylocarpus encephaloides TaxID=45428 RepID=A0A9P8C0Q8_9HELO|nr:glycoside hydrolase family 27 protein [Amylocarpus encephaloides]
MALSLTRWLLAATAVLPQVSGSILSPTPPMGFNNWSAFMCGLNESIFIETAHSMVDNGLLAAGYNRINLDDCWSTMERATNGSMVVDTEKFPRGLPWLTKYLKSLGFIPGIYTDAGLKSCGGYPGAYGYEEIDARDFASWGFDFLKLDGCNMPTGTQAEYKQVYGKWHKILSSLPKPMAFSESAPAYFAEAANLTDWYAVMEWVPEYGQLARHSRDTLVFNSTLYWPDITGWDSILFNYGQEIRLARFQKPGYYNDPDFLIVDHFDLTMDEKRSHFAIWSALSAPLIISAWIPGFSKADFEYLTNKDIIAVNQDKLVFQSTVVSQDENWDVLTKSLSNGDRLLTIINKGKSTASYSVSFERIGLTTDQHVRVKDLWSGKSNVAKNRVTATSIPSHGTAILRLSAVHKSLGRVIPTGKVFNTFSLTTLTASSAGLTWGSSTGVDAQVWQALDDTTIRPLADSRQCLTESGRGKVELTHCNKKLGGQQWDYLYSGNLRSLSSKNCLTESKDHGVVMEKCLYLDNNQVFALPSGVEVVKD